MGNEQNLVTAGACSTGVCASFVRLCAFGPTSLQLSLLATAPTSINYYFAYAKSGQRDTDASLRPHTPPGHLYPLDSGANHTGPPCVGPTRNM